MRTPITQEISAPLATGAALAALLAAAACDPAGPAALDAPAFSREVGLEQLKQQVDAGPARVRVVLEDTGLVARKVRISRPDQLDRPEKVEGRITAVTGSSLTLALGDLTIGFDDATRFRADDDFEDQNDEPDDAAWLASRDEGEEDEDGQPLTAADFVARVQAALDAGRHPAVQAKRAAPSTPQAPDDPQFVASELRLMDEADHPRIAMNVASANLLVNGTPPPDAWIQVLNLKIEVRVSEGVTRLETSTEETDGETEFRGLVQSVSPDDSTVVLASGTVLHLVAGTEFEDADEENHGGLRSLEEVQAALDAGQSVVAKGEGLLTATSPRTLDVVEIRFRVVTTGG